MSGLLHGVVLEPDGGVQPDSSSGSQYSSGGMTGCISACQILTCGPKKQFPTPPAEKSANGVKALASCDCLLSQLTRNTQLNCVGDDSSNQPNANKKMKYTTLTPMFVRIFRRKAPP
mmetsp:Transcript_32846/g.49666  ORF Transcript_32846/g.49666 Transcript_32846/m.49666 type:complete len:117 (-) Transcript_32846:45-395(-)